MKKKILVFLTGGTICSKKDENNENQSNASAVKEMIIDNFLATSSSVKDSVSFQTVSLKKDVLSENFTLNVWCEMIEILSKESIYKDYNGIIILHGTDTLAYTSSLLSIMLNGAKIPIILVSANYDLYNKDTNGYVNFKTAVELIVNGIAPNVYAVYRNTDDKTYLHLGSHLTQCANYSNDFYSKDQTVIESENNAFNKGVKFETADFYISKLKGLTKNVMAIFPYVGLKYTSICLNGISAVLHGTYHSSTVCVDKKDCNDKITDYSILRLLENCKNKDVPVYLSPCNGNEYIYASTGEAIRNGAQCIDKTTFELAYAKLLIGVNMGLKGKDLTEFLNKRVNYEFVY